MKKLLQLLFIIQIVSPVNGQMSIGYDRIFSEFDSSFVSHTFKTLTNFRYSEAPKDSTWFSKARNFNIQPVLQTQIFLGNEIKDRIAAGAWIDWNINSSFTAQIGYQYLTSSPQIYEQNFIDRRFTLPFIGYSKEKKRTQNHLLEGTLSYDPKSWVKFEIGNGKHQIGPGYRSLLLSSFASSYPYAKITSSFWKIRYTNLYSVLKDYNGGMKEDIESKYISTHYLTWQVTKSFELGLFESVIMQSKNGLGKRGFDWNYFNPIIFFRPVEYAQGSADNVLLGLQTKVKRKKWAIYFQASLDEFLLKEVRADIKHAISPNDSSFNYGWWANKYGIQIGVKAKDLFGVRNWDALIELNKVRPFTYSHGSVAQNYAHGGLALAHPLEANFTELILYSTYQWKEYLLTLQVMLANRGISSTTENFGENIYQSYVNRARIYKNKTGQGSPNPIQTFRIDLQRPIIKNKLSIQLGYQLRNESRNSISEFGHFFQVGITTRLINPDLY